MAEFFERMRITTIQQGILLYEIRQFIFFFRKNQLPDLGYGRDYRTNSEAQMMAS